MKQIEHSFCRLRDSLSILKRLKKILKKFKVHNKMGDVEFDEQAKSEGVDAIKFVRNEKSSIDWFLKNIFNFSKTKFNQRANFD